MHSSRLFTTVAVAAMALSGASAGAQAQPTIDVAPYRAAATRLIATATADSSAYARIATLTDRFGNRLSGSPALESAIDWIVAEMKRDGLENVHTEPVMVPHWVRGAESAELVRPRAMSLPMLGLGGSVATPAGGITAEVLVVSSFDDLEAHAANARGRIVVYDVPFSKTADPFTEYGRVVQYRGGGATAAAKVGAVAALVRSVTPNSIRTPHTGAMRYDSATTRIPTAAITAEDAMMLHRMQDRGERPVVHLTMSARTLPDAPSRNVIAEIRGSEKPDEIVVLGGHIDSWDVGAGAMDDAGGAVAAWEALRTMKRLGIRPRRTVRVVLWTNEENGSRGGRAYRDQHAKELDKHVLAMESDEGAFSPVGFAINDEALDSAGVRRATGDMTAITQLLGAINATHVEGGGGDADIAPLVAG
ncbi:MAG TPA: M20/M25/M40 family metallo-hydrolase, partial [Candidatus Elarobacter sp.]|nr:M20/M25/M40 family metallo-hydrolase [Candidatus Elarobacter sp.]